MKKLLCSILIVVSICSAFSGCVTTANAPAHLVDSSDISSEISSSFDYQVGDKVALNDWHITVDKFKFAKSIKNGEYFKFKPDDGCQYAVCYLTIKNMGTEADTFLNYYTVFENNSIKLLYDETYYYSPTELLGHADDLHFKTCNPLVEVSGIIAFSVPDEVVESDKPLVLKITDNNNTYGVSIR